MQMICCLVGFEYGFDLPGKLADYVLPRNFGIGMLLKYPLTSLVKSVSKINQFNLFSECIFAITAEPRVLFQIKILWYKLIVSLKIFIP
jgi:hypothetical protein